MATAEPGIEAADLLQTLSATSKSFESSLREQERLRATSSLGRFLLRCRRRGWHLTGGQCGPRFTIHFPAFREAARSLSTTRKRNEREEPGSTSTMAKYIDCNSHISLALLLWSWLVWRRWWHRTCRCDWILCLMNLSIPSHSPGFAKPLAAFEPAAGAGGGTTWGSRLT